MPRPYRAGSVDCQAPTQDLDPDYIAEWINRIGAYWSHGNSDARSIARALASFIGPDGRLYPALAAIAEVAGCTVQSVYRNLKKFREAGFLGRILRKTGERQTSNAYLLAFPGDAPEPELPPPPEQSSDLSNDKTQAFQEGKDSLNRKPARGSLGWLIERGKRLLELNRDPVRFQREAVESAARQIAALLE